MPVCDVERPAVSGGSEHHQGLLQMWRQRRVLSCSTAALPRIREAASLHHLPGYLPTSRQVQKPHFQ